MPGFFERHRALQALAIRDFRLLLAGSLLVSLAMPVQFLTQVFWVQDEYPGNSVLYTSLIAGSRGLAMLLFSLLGGAIADRFERRRVLLACEASSLAANAGVAALMLTMPLGHGTFWAVTGCTFLGAGVMSIDMPARSASVPAVVGMNRLANAMGLMMVANQLTLPLSLPLVGLLNSAFEPGQVYAGSLALWALILPLIASLRYRSVGGGNREAGMFGNIREGLRYTFGHRTILGVIALVLVVQCIGMPGVANPLGPIWMTEVLGLSKQEFGFMAMTWGIGAMIGSFVFARFHGLPMRGATLCAVALTFGVSVLVFGYSRNVLLTAGANFALGVAFTGMLLTASTLVQHMVADEMRGRVMGLFPLVLGVAQLNTAPIGAVAQEVGLTFMVPALGWATLSLSLLVMASLRGVARARPGHLERPLAVASAGG